MSDAYEDDLAAEEAIFAQIAASQPEPEAATGAPRDRGGRPYKVNPIKLVAWRQAHKASIPETAKRWSVSPATVKRMCRDYGEAAKLERVRWECERLDREAMQHEYDLIVMFHGQRSRHLSRISAAWASACEEAEGTDREATMQKARDAALDEADRKFREDWQWSMGPVPARGS